VELVGRNRESVLAAARRVFLDRGYSGATLDSIAEEAGFSKGVMYSQFESKADLFLALLDRRIDERRQENERIVELQPGLDGLAMLLRAGVDGAPEETAWARVLIEFRSLASRDPQLNARYAAAHERTVRGVAAVLEQLWADVQMTPHYSFSEMAVFILALSSGVALENAAGSAAGTAPGPGTFPTDILAEMVAGALGLTEP